MNAEFQRESFRRESQENSPPAEWRGRTLPNESRDSVLDPQAPLPLAVPHPKRDRAAAQVRRGELGRHL